jgi:hypothetical protein
MKKEEIKLTKIAFHCFHFYFVYLYLNEIKEILI